MKRFNCTLSDKRGEFGECMEAHSTGRYVLFSDVEKLQRRMQEMLDKSNSTGVAIERAISTGSVPAEHPLKSRLELLANHHRFLHLLADLLRESKESIYFQLESPDSNLSGEEACRLIDLQERIDSALAGKLPDPAVSVTETIRTAPERIWLQVGDQSHYHSEPFPSDTSEVSWCVDSVMACEVPYVRADLAAPAVLQGGESCATEPPLSSKAWPAQKPKRPAQDTSASTPAPGSPSTANPKIPRSRP